MEESVDVSALGRKEIMAKLGLGQSSPLRTERLRTEARRRLKKDHKIHKYISQLSQESLSELYMIIFKKSGHRHYDQLKSAMTNGMFKKFPKAPLTTLIWIRQSGKIPTEIEFTEILQNLSENSVSNPSQNLGNLTLTENLDNFTNHEVSHEGELTSSNNKKQKLDPKDATSASKKFKSNNEADMSNGQVDIPSFTGRKFENTENTENNICYSGANFCWNKPCFM